MISENCEINGSDGTPGGRRWFIQNGVTETHALSLIGIERQDLGNERAQFLGRDLVVQEQQVVPALCHHPRRHGRGPGTMPGGEQNGIGPKPLGAAFFGLSGWMRGESRTRQSQRFYRDSVALMTATDGVKRGGDFLSLGRFLRCSKLLLHLSFSTMPNNTEPAADTGGSHTKPDATTDVYAVHGADPEVLAYGMAKYSRSALSLRESLAELNEQKAEKFLNTFYFQYGHRSIADLAHVAFAVEKLSILAATIVVDEPRWDGQERSTRYQDFQKSGYYVPDFGDDDAARTLYRETVDFLFAEYRHFSDEMFRYLREGTPKPAEMKQDAYERTLKARAFDLSRYLLPMATNTSLGQIVSARTLENQVSRLLSDTHAEVRRIGELLKQAAREDSYNVNRNAASELAEQIGRECPALAERANAFLLREVRVAPTLMKYAEPNAYDAETRRDLTRGCRRIAGERAD